MSKKEMEESIKAVPVLLPAVHAVSTINSSGVDCKDFESVMFALDAGVATATGTLDVKIQESSDNSTFTDITGAAFVQVDVDNDNDIYLLRVKSRNFKRYLRTVSVIGTDTVTANIVAYLGFPSALAPVTQAQTAVTVDYV